MSSQPSASDSSLSDRADAPMRAVRPAASFVFAIGWGALVLFQLQPMLAKPILPVLGGTPLVWQTCMMVFQCLLLTGYAYAFWLGGRPLGMQRVVHPLLWIVAVSTLLFPLPPLAVLDPALHPVAWLCEKLLREIGLPFLALSSTTPLLQRWALLHRPALGRHAFRLYAASNFGSLAGLLGYPFLVEPWFSLREQRGLLLVAFVLQAVLVSYGAWKMRLVRETPAEVRETPPMAAPSWRQQGLWVLYAALGCSLMLGASQHIALDIASVPLLWVLPLAIYLVSFMIAFGRHGAALGRLRRYELLLTAIAVIVNLVNAPGLWLLPLLLLTLLVACTLVHGWLAAAQPAPQMAGRYYLMISLGGVLAGIFNSLLAPQWFDEVIEFSLTLLAVVAVVVWRAATFSADSAPSPVRTSAVLWKQRADLAVVSALGVALLLVCHGIPDHDVAHMVVMAVLCLLFLLARLMRPSALLLQAVPLLLMVVWSHTVLLNRELILQKRSWFGVMRVADHPENDTHTLAHGTTIHGLQRRAQEHRRDVLSYYMPLTRIWASLPADIRARPYAVIGLGAGTLACLDGPGHPSDFYEIDPEMIAIARNPDYFSYLAECGARTDIVLGDGRLSMQKASGGKYGLIVLDAFSSDSVPVHMLTREAVRLYLDKLAPGGLVALHVSNRYLDLVPVLAAIAQAEGLQGGVMHYTVESQAQSKKTGIVNSDWVFLSRVPLPGNDDLSTRILPFPATRPDMLWTDDYSALWRVVK